MIGLSCLRPFPAPGATFPLGNQRWRENGWCGLALRVQLHSIVCCSVLPLCLFRRLSSHPIAPPCPSLYLQAMSLLINMTEDLCLGAAHSGDVVYDLFDGAFGVSREPAPTAAAGAGLLPSPGRSLGTEEGLRSALGGADALARFLSASPVAPSAAAS